MEVMDSATGQSVMEKGAGMVIGLMKGSGTTLGMMMKQ